jgi:hypothetical protein
MKQSKDRTEGMTQKYLTGLFCGLLCFVIASNSAIAADYCMTNKELQAERVRALQSGLMFSALKCIHKPHLRLTENYNDIMARHGGELAAQFSVVQKYFRRTRGASHRRQLHKYVTGMANKYSVVSFGEPQFCESMSALGASILTGDEDIILNARFERDLLVPALAKTCKAEETPMLARLNRQVPDLVSIHMPEIDTRLRLEAQALYGAQ